MTGRLIAFEGIDGAGKSTQLDLFARRLEDMGRRVVRTREPTGGAYGSRIRIAASKGLRLEPDEELRLFMEDRAEHVETCISPSLRDGLIVLTDRYYLSTVAYQGSRGHDVNSLLRENERRFPLPDIAFLLEVDTSNSLARVEQRSFSRDVFEESRTLDAVSTVFDDLNLAYLVRIDAVQSIDTVHGEIMKEAQRRIVDL